MQIVIDIPENEYQHTICHYKSFPRDISRWEQRIVDGTQLPKGCDIQRIIPKKVDVQKWIYTKCPNSNCNYELSTHHGDGYYSIECKPDFCPNCGQALLWESEDKE